MCLSTVYKAEGDALEEVCTYVSSAQDKGGSVEFTDVMGSVTVVPGTIESVDRVANKIIVRVA